MTSAREHERLTIADTAQFIGEVLPIELSHREQQELLSALYQRTEMQFYRARRLCSPAVDDVNKPVASIEQDEGDEDDVKYSTAACELNEFSPSSPPHSKDGDVDKSDGDETIANTEDGLESTIQSSFLGSQPGCYGIPIFGDNSGPANTAPVPLPHQVFDGLPMDYPSTFGDDDGTVGQFSTQQSGYGPPRDCTTAFCWTGSDFSDHSVTPTPPSPQRLSSSISRFPNRSNDDDEFSATVPDLDCSNRQPSISASSTSTLSWRGDDDDNSNAPARSLPPPSPPSIQHFSNYPPSTPPSPRATTYRSTPISSPSDALAEKTRYFHNLPVTPEWDPPASKQPEPVDSDADPKSPARFFPSPKPSNAGKHTKRAVTYGGQTRLRHVGMIGRDTSDVGNGLTAGYVARSSGESRVNLSRMPRGPYQSPSPSGKDERAPAVQFTEAATAATMAEVSVKTGVKRGRPPARARGDDIKVEDGDDDEVKIKVEDDEYGDEGREKKRRRSL